jgi:hypothetical protein
MRLLLRTVTCAIAALTACGGGTPHQALASEGALLAAMGDPAVLGRFDVAFPARIVRVQASAADLRFEHRGTTHVYPEQIGMSVSAVFLEHERGVGVLVVSAPQPSSPLR